MKSESTERKSQLDSLTEQLERDLRSIRSAMRQPLEIEAAKGELTGPQTAVMRAVIREEGINLRDLSKVVSLAHSTVSGIVDRLEKSGMVERQTDSKDGRVSCIFPTAPVRDFVQHRIPELSRGPLLLAMARASVKERAAIADGIGKLRVLLEDQ
jgi:DNA-binding MarR family transcriptional regulator